MSGFWIGLIIVLTFIEGITVNLTTIWFVISGIVALILSFITDNILIQVGVFVILGIVLLILTKPFLDKWLKGKHAKTNLDRIIGMQGVVTEEIKPFVAGEVKVDGKKWTAISDQELKEGEFVRVLEINSVKLKVTRWEE